MKKQNWLRLIAGILAISLLALTGCAAEDTTETAGEKPADTGEAFSYSEGIDDNGLWSGIKALDYVQLCAYEGIVIPADVHTITEDAVQAEIDGILTNYADSAQVTDRAIANGDTVNIDFVGSVDGVEFDGGSTGGAGTDVTIGVTSYIDDFLEQLIGHKPGENFDIEVTFPDPYSNNPDLAGKEAVFNITVNYISVAETPELTDAFVAENLAASYGWVTVSEMREGIREKLQHNAVSAYIQDYVVDNSTVKSTPEALVTYQANAMLDYYQSYAEMYGITLEEFVSSQIGYDSVDALLADSKAENTISANFYLIIQAIAEDAKISVSNEDVGAYFSEHMGIDDYSEYEGIYGLPYLKQVTLHELVFHKLSADAVLA